MLKGLVLKMESIPKGQQAVVRKSILDSRATGQQRHQAEAKILVGGSAPVKASDPPHTVKLQPSQTTPIPPNGQQPSKAKEPAPKPKEPALTPKEPAPKPREPAPTPKEPAPKPREPAPKSPAPGSQSPPPQRLQAPPPPKMPPHVETPIPQHQPPPPAKPPKKDKAGG